MSSKLKQITTKAKALYKSGKFAKWTDAIKAASKGIGATKKTAAKKSSYHKDTKSHNVNIRVMSGKVGALPIDFKGSFLGYSFSIVNQYTLDGGVTAVFLDKEKVKIVELNGRKDEEARAINILTSRAKANFSADRGYQLDSADSRQLEQRVKKFIVQLNGEVRAYNSGKDRNVKKVKPVKITYTKTVKKLSLVDEIKTLLKANKKILKGGYVVKPGNVRFGNIKVSGALKNDFTTITFYNKLKEEILQREEVIHNVTVVRKNDLIKANGKAWFNKWVREAKKHLAAQKKLLAQVKKSI